MGKGSTSNSKFRCSVNTDKSVPNDCNFSLLLEIELHHLRGTTTRKLPKQYIGFTDL